MRFMRTRTWAALGVAVLAGTLAGPVAGASAAKPAAAEAPALERAARAFAATHGIGANGTARLQVDGDGTVRLTGRLVTFGLLPRRSTIWVVDRAGDARFVFDGRQPRVGAERATRVRGSGRFYLSGSNVLLRVRGEDVSISAAGRGRLQLRGDGVYKLNDSPAMSWPTVPTPPVAVVPLRRR
jgi:hypothetical protein